MQDRIQLETAIASCLLISGGKNANQIDIDANDFIYEPAKAVYLTALEHGAIDPVVCFAHAKSIGMELKMSAITDLLTGSATSANLSYYVTALKKAIYGAKYQELRRKYSAIIKDADDVVEMAQMIAYEDHALRLKYLEIESGKSLMDCCADLISRIVNREENKALVKTGWDMMDDLNGGGFLPNEIVIIAARPSVGKTAAALQLLRNKQNKPVMFSLEMDNSQFAPRLLAQVAKENTMLAARNPAMLSENSRENFISHASDLLELAENVKIYDDHDQTIDVIRRRARKEVEKGARFIIIDYLQLLEDEKAQNRDRALAKISRSLKNMGKELQIPIFVLAQLNRACEIEKRSPQLSDLRESGAIEQDANTVIFIYDTGAMFANDDGSPSNKKRVMFKKAKGRDTGTGLKQAIFNPDHQTFYEEKLDLSLLNRKGA
jgi:replicative DNA helicase